MTRVLVPLPSEGFEPTEAAMPWQRLRTAGMEVVFTTPDGDAARCDPLALERRGFGQIGARAEHVAAYRELENDPAFASPLPYDEVDPEAFDALHLTGGHAPGMRPYLESERVQAIAASFFARGAPVSAICHGPIVLARARDAEGRSLLAGRRLTCLTKLMERSAYWLTCWTLGRHFRTYPEYVQDEVVAAIGDRSGFVRGPLMPSYDQPFTVRDGNLFTGRWPGDAERLADDFVALLQEGGVSS